MARSAAIPPSLPIQTKKNSRKGAKGAKLAKRNLLQEEFHLIWLCALCAFARVSSSPRRLKDAGWGGGRRVRSGAPEHCVRISRRADREHDTDGASDAEGVHECLARRIPQRRANLAFQLLARREGAAERVLCRGRQRRRNRQIRVGHLNTIQGGDEASQDRNAERTAELEAR